MSSHLYYTPTGRTTSGYVVSAYLLMTAIAYGLAITYTLFIMVIPIIYLNALITGALGLVLAFTSRNIAKLMKMRNKKEYISLVVFSAFMTWYFSWIVYVSIVLESFPGAGKSGLHLDLVFNWPGFFGVVNAIYTHGLYSFFGGQVNGWVLALVWTLEVGIIFLIPYFLVSRKSLAPFSEKMNRFYPKYNLKQFFENISAANKFKTELEKNYMETISAMGKGLANRYGQISIYYLKNDPDAYLSLTNVFIEAQGTGKRVETSVLHGFRISAKDAEILMEKYKVDKEFFLDH